MMYAVFRNQQGDIYTIIVKRNDGSFSSLAVAYDKASAELIVDALNSFVKKKEKKNARA